MIHVYFEKSLYVSLQGKEDQTLLISTYNKYISVKFVSHIYICMRMSRFHTAIEDIASFPVKFP